jgi:hypothetical protein
MALQARAPDSKALEGAAFGRADFVPAGLARQQRRKTQSPPAMMSPQVKTLELSSEQT